MSTIYVGLQSLAIERSNPHWQNRSCYLELHVVMDRQMDANVANVQLVLSEGAAKSIPGAFPST
jgi:hypothetical protein